MRAVSHGLCVGKYAEFSVDEPIANSSMFALPRMTIPASFIRVTIVASYGGTQPWRIFDPAVVGTPAVTTTSFSARGAPVVHHLGGGQRAVEVEVQERAQLPVHRGDPVQVRLRDLHRGGLAAGNRGGQLDRGHGDEVGAHASPPRSYRTCTPRKRSASSTFPRGPRSSGRGPASRF